MIIFEKVIMSKTEPGNSEALWLRIDETHKELLGFGANGWETLCDFNNGDNATIKDITEKLTQINNRLTIVEGNPLVWKEA